MPTQIKNKNVLIFSDGELRSFRGLKDLFRSCNYVICADGGIKNAEKFKIKPDLIVGDFDSADLRSLLRKYGKDKIKVYPVNKDRSDTEIAVSYSYKNKAKKIIILGALGKRMDHTLANIFTLSKYPCNISIVDEYSEITVHDKSISLLGKKGEIISLFPVLGNVRVISSHGLKFPLNNLLLKAGSHGLSNEFKGKRAKINFKRGKILVIRTKRS